MGKVVVVTGYCSCCGKDLGTEYTWAEENFRAATNFPCVDCYQNIMGSFGDEIKIAKAQIKEEEQSEEVDNEKEIQIEAEESEELTEVE